MRADGARHGFVPISRERRSLAGGAFLHEILSGRARQFPERTTVSDAARTLRWACTCRAASTWSSAFWVFPQELPQDLDAGLMRSHLAVAYAIDIAIDAYVSPLDPLTVTLFTASGQERNDPLLGWARRSLRH